jgi:hypothetical protein
MSRKQTSLLQTLAIWVGFVLFSFPLILTLLSFMVGWFPGLLTLFLAVWVAICLMMSILARWIGLRTALIGTATFLIGIPIAVFISMHIPNSTFYSGMSNDNTFVSGETHAIVIFGFLGFWSILSGLITRNARGMYAALHLANWLLSLSVLMLLLMDPHFLLYLALPLGIMLLLLVFSQPIMQILSVLPWINQTEPSGAIPKPSDFQGYEDGYQPFYEEGGNTSLSHPYERQNQSAYMPQSEMQQRQQDL